MIDIERLNLDADRDELEAAKLVLQAERAEFNAEKPRIRIRIRFKSFRA